MLRGAAESLWECLKTKGNFCEPKRGQIRAGFSREDTQRTRFIGMFLWLGRQDSNLRLVESKSAAARLAGQRATILLGIDWLSDLIGALLW